MIYDIDYNELARQDAKKKVVAGQQAKTLVENPVLEEYTQRRFEELFTAFSKHDPADVPGLQLLCIQSREMHRMITELETSITMGELAAEGLSAQQNEGDEEESDDA